MTDLRTADPRLRRLIDALAAYYGLPAFRYGGHTYSPGELLEGLVLTESSGNPEARRYEPHQDRAGRADVRTDPDRPGADDAKAEDDASWGVLQLMGYNWRRIIGAPPGTPLNFGILFDMGFGLVGGLRILRDELAAVAREWPAASDGEQVARALARYNGGPTGDDPTGAHGDMRLRAYVDKVAANARLAKENREDRGWRSA